MEIPGTKIHKVEYQEQIKVVCIVSFTSREQMDALAATYRIKVAPKQATQPILAFTVLAVALPFC